MSIKSKYVDYDDEDLLIELVEYLNYVNRDIKSKKLPYRYNDLYHLGEISFKLYHLYVEHNRENRENENNELYEKIGELKNE